MDSNIAPLDVAYSRHLTPLYTMFLTMRARPREPNDRRHQFFSRGAVGQLTEEQIVAAIH